MPITEIKKKLTKKENTNCVALIPIVNLRESVQARQNTL